MWSEETRNFGKLRKSFENREAIYIEHGFLRVRVHNIRDDLAARWIVADIDEIPTAGFEAGLFQIRIPTARRPLRWQIGGGFMTQFSDHTWHCGYGGWSMFFETRVVQGVVELAAQWTADLDEQGRYREVLEWLGEHNAYERTRPVFTQR